ncbi:MAG: diacylglycerol kinase family lipid kinase [Oscillochloris sp.]|nr:diacylglycerol kinase family lipid kinase [Oscillochloris sp.]
MRTVIVFNPTAGQAELLEHDLGVAAGVWRQHGWHVDLRPTLTAGDGTRIARAAADEGCDLVVAAGGDGTINEVINGLAGTDTALGTLPFGTMNVWARELRLPLQPRAAAEALLSWQTRRIDLGQAGDRYFLLMAGIGFDAAITAGIKRDEKRRLGALAYVLRGLELALRVRGARTRLILDGRPIKARVLMVVIGNTQLYGGLVKITHRASIDDGLLDVCVIRGDNFFSALRHTIAILGQRRSHDPEIAYYRARRIEVIARPRLPIQVDGDAISTTPMTFSVAPGALLALLPPNLPQDLVQQPNTTPIRVRRAMPRVLAWLSRRPDREP